MGCCSPSSWQYSISAIVILRETSTVSEWLVTTSGFMHLTTVTAVMTVMLMIAIWIVERFIWFYDTIAVIKGCGHCCRYGRRAMAMERGSDGGSTGRGDMHHWGGRGDGVMICSMEGNSRMTWTSLQRQTGYDIVGMHVSMHPGLRTRTASRYHPPWYVVDIAASLTPHRLRERTWSRCAVHCNARMAGTSTQVHRHTTACGLRAAIVVHIRIGCSIVCRFLSHGCSADLLWTIFTIMNNYLGVNSSPSSYVMHSCGAGFGRAGGGGRTRMHSYSRACNWRR